MSKNVSRLFSIFCKTLVSLVPNVISGIPPTDTHSGTIIFLHGLGDIGETWIEYFKYIERSDLKFIFPTAPKMPVSVNNGLVMPSWFDIFEISENPKKQDKEGIIKARDYLESLVTEEIKAGTPPEKIIIGGISQGGATTILTALTTKLKLAGIIFLSSFIPLVKDLPPLVSEVNRDTPIFHAHGEKDKLISFGWCKNTLKWFQDWFSDVEFRSDKDLGHWVSVAEFQYLRIWINKILPPKSIKQEDKTEII